MTTNRRAVRLVKQIKTPPSKVFEALTVPEHIRQWLGVDDGETLSAEADRRREGPCSIVLRMLDGREHDPSGVYKEVVHDRMVVFTWEWPGRNDWESLVTIERQPGDIGTEPTLTHEDLSDEAADIHEAGRTGFLQQLDRHFGDHE